MSKSPQKPSGTSGLPDFSALAAAVSKTSATSEAPDFSAIAKIVGGEAPTADEPQPSSEDAEVESETPSPFIIQTDRAKPVAKSASTAKPVATVEQPKAKAPEPSAAVKTAEPNPVAIKVAAPVKPAAPAQPAAPAKVAAPVKVAAAIAPVKTPAPKPAPAPAKQPVKKAETEAPSLDFLLESVAANTKPSAPEPSTQATSTQSSTSPAAKAEPTETQPAREKSSKRTTAAAAVPGFSEFAAIAASVSEAPQASDASTSQATVVQLPAVDVGSPKADAIQPSVTPAASAALSPNLAGVSVNQAGGVAVAPKLGTPELASKKRSTADRAANQMFSYLAEATAITMFLTAGYQVYAAINQGTLPADAPEIIATAGIGVGLLAAAQILRALTHLTSAVHH